MKFKSLAMLVVASAASVGFGVCRAQSPLAVPEIPEHPALANPESFSMIVLGDPQSYLKFLSNQPLFDLQTAWIAENMERLNTKAVLVTGDMVEQNNKIITHGRPHPLNGNRTSRQQWEAASHSFEYLDNRLPYIITQGNHDAGYTVSENRMSELPKYFYPERNVAFETSLVETTTNYFGENTLENAAYEFTLPNWGRMLVIATEFAPRREVFDWIKGLIESDRYRDDRVVILTHSMLNHSGEINPKMSYKLQGATTALEMWEDLIYPSKNIDMVICGHACHIPEISDDARELSDIDYSQTVAFREEKAADGRKVPIMMFNAQTADGKWFGNGGDTWLRILEFMPDGKTIQVRTFSPMFAKSKLTRHLAYRDAPYDNFSFTVPGAPEAAKK